MTHDKRSEWERDALARQRNIVFPDTTANEARFWRNLMTGRRKLSAAQVIGVCLMSLTLAAALYAVVSTQFRVSDAQQPLLKRVLGSFGVWIFLLVVGVGILIGSQVVSRRRKRPKMSVPK